jgi:hypothetical protein
VECISKGKAHKRYEEFGCKVSLAVSSKGGWVLAAQALEGNPYDGHTLRSTLDRLLALTGIEPEHVYADMRTTGATTTRGGLPGACSQPQAGLHRWLGVALDEAAGGDRAYHRASKGREADGEESAQGE